jgi:hypothetical protein
LGLIHPSIIFHLHLWFLFLVTSKGRRLLSWWCQRFSLPLIQEERWGCQGSLELVWNHVWMDEKIATFSLPIWRHVFHFYPSFVGSLINNLTPFLLAFSGTYQLCSFQDKNLKNESRSQQLKDNSS